MNAYNQKFEVDISAHEDAPGMPHDTAVVTVRVKEVSGGQMDRAVCMRVARRDSTSYVANAFRGIAHALDKQPAEYVGITYCVNCTQQGKCRLEKAFRAKGIDSPFCTAGAPFVFMPKVSVKLGDVVRCAECGEAFELDDKTLWFDSEAEWVTCPHCKTTLDVQVYLAMKEETE